MEGFFYIPCINGNNPTIKPTAAAKNLSFHSQYFRSSVVNSLPGKWAVSWSQPSSLEIRANSVSYVVFDSAGNQPITEKVCIDSQLLLAPRICSGVGECQSPPVRIAILGTSFTRLARIALIVLNWELFTARSDFSSCYNKHFYKYECAYLWICLGFPGNFDFLG